MERANGSLICGKKSIQNCGTIIPGLGITWCGYLRNAISRMCFGNEQPRYFLQVRLRSIFISIIFSIESACYTIFLMQKKKSHKKETTLDDLANAMGQGFKEVQGQFKEVQQQFKEVHERIDGFEKNVEGRFNGLEEQTNIIRQEIQLMHFDNKKIESRVERLEMKTFGSVQL